MRTLFERRAAMAEKYQSSAKKSTKKFEVVGDRQLAVRLPLPLVEVWEELQPEVEHLTGLAGLKIIRAATNRRERCKPNAPNQVWSLDFVADQLADGRRFRALTIVDVFTRESLAIEPGQSLKGVDVIHVLSRICLQRATPKTLF